MLTAETFLREIETFLKRSEMSATAFGRLAVSDPNLLSDLRAGRMPSLRLVGKVYAFMQAHKRTATSSPARVGAA